MGRLFLTALSAVAVLTILAEGLAGGLLWSQGRLNPDAIREIRVILSDPDALTEEQERAKETPLVSANEVIESRAIRILHLEQREAELATLRNLTADFRTKINAEQEALLTRTELFEKQQKLRQEKVKAAGIELSTTVLLASDVDLAVSQLTELTLEETIILMKGMPEKHIAKLLAAFAAGDKLQMERGQQVFQAITRGSTAETQEGSKE